MRRHENEPIVVQRDVKAVIIPAGIEVKLRTGSVGYITQALGGSFTIYVEGNLFRIAGDDADAIGKEPFKKPELPPGASDEDVRNLVWEQLKSCFDPEIPINVVDLGLIYEKTIDEKGDVKIRMTLTAPACPVAGEMPSQVAEAVAALPGAGEVEVTLTWDPPWDKEKMSEDARLALGFF